MDVEDGAILECFDILVTITQDIWENITKNDIQLANDNIVVVADKTYQDAFGTKTIK